MKSHILTRTAKFCTFQHNKKRKKGQAAPGRIVSVVPMHVCMIITAREKLHDTVHSAILEFHLAPVSHPADGSCKLPKNNNNFSYFSKEMAANSALYIARRHRKQRKFTSQLPNKGTFLASSFAVQGGGRGGEGSGAKSIRFDQ